MAIKVNWNDWTIAIGKAQRAFAVETLDSTMHRLQVVCGIAGVPLLVQSIVEGATDSIRLK